MDEVKEICKRIIVHYGHEHQLSKNIEELTELIHVIARRLQSYNWDKVAFYEELADVYVMLEQLKMIFAYEEGITPAELEQVLKDEMHVKLKRTESRMDKDDCNASF